MTHFTESISYCYSSDFHTLSVHRAGASISHNYCNTIENRYRSELPTRLGPGWHMDCNTIHRMLRPSRHAWTSLCKNGDFCRGRAERNLCERELLKQCAGGAAALGRWRASTLPLPSLSPAGVPGKFGRPGAAGGRARAARLRKSVSMAACRNAVAARSAGVQSAQSELGPFAVPPRVPPRVAPRIPPRIPPRVPPMRGGLEPAASSGGVDCTPARLAIPAG